MGFCYRNKGTSRFESNLLLSSSLIFALASCNHFWSRVSFQPNWSTQTSKVTDIETSNFTVEWRVLKQDCKNQILPLMMMKIFVHQPVLLCVKSML